MPRTLRSRRPVVRSAAGNRPQRLVCPCRDRSRRSGVGRVRRVDSAASDVQVMERQGPIQSLPQVPVLDRHHLTEALPSPAITSPFVQPVGQPSVDVLAGRDQGHARGLVERFQTAHNGEQFQPLALEFGLGVSDVEGRRSIGRLQDESPFAPVIPLARVGEQEEVRCGDTHCWFLMVPWVGRNRAPSSGGTGTESTLSPLAIFSLSATVTYTHQLN
jgi:hypothetical protein